MESQGPPLDTATAAEPPGGAEHGLRVLVVDDSDHVLRAARGLLHTVPRISEVVTTGSGAAALDLAARDAFHLCLVDLSMEGLNGLEVARRLRAMPCSPRIVVMSLHDEPEFESAAVAAGADRLIHKPSLGVLLEGMLVELFGP